MKPTLATGANGHVGTNLWRLLVERCEPVRARVRPTADTAALDGPGVEIARADVRDAAAVRDAVAGCARVHRAAAGFHTTRTRDPSRRSSARASTAPGSW